MKQILFDSSWLAHRAKHSMGNLSHGDTATGVIFGLLELVRSTALSPRIRSNQCHLFFDSVTSVRQQAFPGYKGKRQSRERTPQEREEQTKMHDQMGLLRREVLPECGFGCHIQGGMESDDLMASAALSPMAMTEGCVIITADNDLYQCISPTCHWYDPSRNLYLDVGGFLDRKRVLPSDWVRVKCLMGCNGDDVPGIPGVGEKTAVDYLWKLLDPEGAKVMAIESPTGKKVRLRNLTLVELPHQDTQDVTLAIVKYNPKAFYRWCNKLGFASFSDGPRRRMWDAFFAGDFDGEVRVQPRKVIKRS